VTPDRPMDILTQCLLDLLHGLEGKGFPLILCGGFGLYLKQVRRQEQGFGHHPLLPGDLWPRPRTTEEIDILVRTEILADAERFSRLRQVLDDLTYRPVPGAEYMQFIRRLDSGGWVKVDLLTGPVPDALGDKVTVRNRRVRPAGRSVGLHAHRADEAIGFQTNLQAISIEGYCTDGRPCQGVVFIPPAVTFLMMKLFAFNDRHRDEQKDFARHHAMDLYRVVAMLSYDEFQRTRAVISAHWQDEILQEASQMIADYFATPTSLGLIRMQEHDLFEPDMDTREFSRALTDLFAEP